MTCMLFVQDFVSNAHCSNSLRQSPLAVVGSRSLTSSSAYWFHATKIQMPGNADLVEGTEGADLARQSLLMTLQDMSNAFTSDA